MLMFATFGSTAFAEVSAGRRGGDRRRAHRARPAAAARRLRQVGAGAAAVLAARRDGGPDPGVGADPRRDDGHRRCLPGRPVELHLRERPRRRRPRWSSSARSRCCGGAVIGCAKDDIKKALAGSTMSQIGYMMLAAGLGVAGYAFAIFHLLTHGFFKANMFLGAGSVMHAHGRRRRHAALRRAAEGDAGHLPDLRDGLPRDHRVPAGSPASGPRTRSSRPRSRTTWSSAWPPCSAPGSPRST